MSKLPCIDCICLAICKHKCLRSIFCDCKLMTTYWGIHINLQSRDKAALIALSTVQELNLCMNRVLIPSYLDDVKGERFGLLDVEPMRDDRKNVSTVLRTCRIYYEEHSVNLLELKTIGECLNVALEDHIPLLYLNS